MKFIVSLAALLFLFLGKVEAQKKSYEIQVKILHNGKEYFDTTFTNSPHKSSLIIQEIVSRYSSETVYLNANRLHGLYVFNITDTNWKGNRKKAGTKKLTREIEINIDSLVNEIKQSVEKQWEELNMKQLEDSLNKSLEELKFELKAFKKEIDPDFEAFKKEMKLIIERMKQTRIVIIREGDTIRLD